MIGHVQDGTKILYASLNLVPNPNFGTIKNSVFSTIPEFYYRTRISVPIIPTHTKAVSPYAFEGAADSAGYAGSCCRRQAAAVVMQAVPTQSPTSDARPDRRAGAPDGTVDRDGNGGRLGGQSQRRSAQRWRWRGTCGLRIPAWRVRSSARSGSRNTGGGGQCVRGPRDCVPVAGGLFPGDRASQAAPADW